MRPMMLYRDLIPWYRLVDPHEDHWDEATSYIEAFAHAIVPPVQTLLELGAGAGNNAFYFKQRFRCTLTDLSEDMLALSRGLNPECEHVAGDMRTLRLGRTFDAIMIHDAVMYMTSEEDLLAVARTAFEHTRAGGAAIFAPDYVRETFREKTNVISGDSGTRSLRGIEWAWDPDPADDTYRVEYAFLLRDGDAVTSVHDTHIEGLFSRETWTRILTSVGYEVELVVRHDEDMTDEVFLARRT
ncbi:MAG: class I SAM-dependent methyltransferase [Acidobacteria bacterium]|nr:MAG: class I SAM-dependent methyltransferase [Acidobacteriota bacterium]